MLRTLVGLSVVLAAAGCSFLRPEHPYACVELPTAVCEEAWTVVSQRIFSPAGQHVDLRISRPDSARGECDPGVCDDMVVVRATFDTGDAEAYILRPAASGRLEVVSTSADFTDPGCRLSDPEC